MFVTRFAPSPTGYLHLGHAFSALTAFDAAGAAGGRCLLRIEDIDQTRCRPEYEAAILEDLTWLDLRWPEPVLRQSDHMESYMAAIETLRTRGLVYRCFKTRKEILDEIARAPHLSPDGPEGPTYIGDVLSAAEERALVAEGRPFAWRLSMKTAIAQIPSGETLSFVDDSDGTPREFEATPEIFGDVILGRKDSGASYHLASVIDDARQNVTHVIRGEDLKAAAHLHRLLQSTLDLPTPIYRHHRLITDENGKRLAKRNKAATIRARREAGDMPNAIRTKLGLQPAGR